MPRVSLKGMAPIDYEMIVRDLLAAKLNGVLPTGKMKTFHRKTYQGKSGYRHEIDASIELCFGGFPLQLLVECKYYGKPVEVGEILKFAARIQDIPGTNVGIIVTTVGFQEGAHKVAKSEGIWLAVVEHPDIAEIRAVAAEAWARCKANRDRLQCLSYDARDLGEYVQSFFALFDWLDQSPEERLILDVGRMGFAYRVLTDHGCLTCTRDGLLSLSLLQFLFRETETPSDY